MKLKQLHITESSFYDKKIASNFFDSLVLPLKLIKYMETSHSHMQHLQTVKRGQAAPHSTLESSRLFSSHDNAPYMPLWSRFPKQYPPYLLFSNVPNNPVSGTFGLKPRKSAVKARSFHPHQAKSKVFTQLPRGPIQPCPTHLSNEWHLLCPPIRRPLGLHFPKFL